MNCVRKFIALPALFVLLCGGQVSSATKLVIAGHSYSQQKYGIDRFTSAMNQIQADYHCFLGDCDFWNDSIWLQYKSKLERPILSVPGNHDLENGKDVQYLQNIGYTQKALMIEGWMTLMINTSVSVEELRGFINASLDTVSKSVPILVLGHHRIWDDGIVDMTPMGHDKSYYFEEIKDLFENRAVTLFAGNSPRQYFKQGPAANNSNVVYWCDKINHITAYSVGMGGLSSFVEVNLDSVNVTVQPHVVPKISESQIKSPAKGKNHRSAWNRVAKAMKSNTFLFGVCFGLGFAVVTTLLIAIIRKKKRS